MGLKTTHNNIKQTANLTGGFDEIRAAITKSERVLIATHLDPDGDAIGTQLAFASYVEHLGKKLYLVRDGELPYKYRFLSGASKIVNAADYKVIPEIDTAIILECPNLARLGKAESFISERVNVVNLDHHQDNSFFGDVNVVDSLASSVGEIAYRYFSHIGFSISDKVAEHLFTAILTDTGRFRFSSTSAETLRAAANLIAAGASPQHINNMVYYNIPPAAIKLVGKVLNEIEFFLDGRLCVLSLTRAMLDETGAGREDSEGLVDYTLYSKGVEVGILLKELGPDQTKLSLRSRDGTDVAQLAGRYGGGGHINAAGCLMKSNLQQAKSTFVELVTELLNNG